MPDRHPAPLVLGALFVLMGLLVGTGGVWLIALGGSWYYLPGGLVLVLTGLLLLQRNPAALWVHAALLTATLAWSVWEAGLNWWALVARGDVLFLLALVMLTPWFARGLVAATRQPARQGLTAALGAFTAVAAVAWFQGSGYGPGEAIAQEVPALAAPSVEAAAHPRPHSLEGRLAAPLPAPSPNAGNGPREVGWPLRTDVAPSAAAAGGFPPAALHAAHQVFFCTPQPALVALDAATGTPLWRHALEPGAAADCEALSYQPPAAGPGAGAAEAAPKATHAVLSRPATAESRCDARLFVPMGAARVLALNPLDGRPCAELGTGGGVIALQTQPAQGSAHPPEAIVALAATGDRLLVASAAGPARRDDAAMPAARLTLQAYDLRTGAPTWQWQPPAGLAPAPGRQPLTHIDDALGLLYVMGRTGTAAEGGIAVAALDLASGRLRWRFESEEPAGPGQPVAVAAGAPAAAPVYFADLRRGPAHIPALVHPTGGGHAIVLDRRTGTPLQPASGPASGAGSRPPSGADLWGVTLLDQLACRIAFERLRFQDRFSPRDAAMALPAHGGTLGRFHWPDLPGEAPGTAALQVSTGGGGGSALPAPRRAEPGPLMVQTRSTASAESGPVTLVQLQPLRSPLGLPCQSPRTGSTAPPLPSSTGVPQAPAPAVPMTTAPPSRPDLLVHTGNQGTPGAASAVQLAAAPPQG